LKAQPSPPSAAEAGRYLQYTILPDLLNEGFSGDDGARSAVHKLTEEFNSYYGGSNYKRIHDIPGIHGLIKPRKTLIPERFKIKSRGLFED
jgi:hypothetical protein